MGYGCTGFIKLGDAIARIKNFCIRSRCFANMNEITFYIRLTNLINQGSPALAAAKTRRYTLCSERVYHLGYIHALTACIDGGGKYAIESSRYKFRYLDGFIKSGI